MLYCWFRNQVETKGLACRHWFRGLNPFVRTRKIGTPGH